MMKRFLLLINFCFCCYYLKAQYSKDVTGHGTAEAISEHQGTTPNLAEYAFDEDTIYRGWANEWPDNRPWLLYDFGVDSAKNIQAYRFYLSSLQDNSWVGNQWNPTMWVVEGTNDSNWTVLDTVVADGLITDEWYFFELPNELRFSKYRFTFLRSPSEVGFVRVTEIEMFEKIEPAAIQTIENEFSLYPNPIEVGEKLFIQSTEEIKQIQVFDIQGNLLQKQNQVDRIVLDRSGVFVVKINTPFQTRFERIIVESH